MGIGMRFWFLLRGYLLKALKLVSFGRIGTQVFWAQSTRYERIRSLQAGDFCMYVGDRALSLLEERSQLLLPDIDRLAHQIFESCGKLGFHPRPGLTFKIDVQPVKNAKTPLTVARIVPPIELGKDQVTHSILIFGPEFETEMEMIERQTTEAYRRAGIALDHDQIAQLKEVAIPARQAKALMSLSHEMVHLFVTDEYSELAQKIGLEKLELLTDSINWVTHFPRYQSGIPLIQGAFAEGAGYLCNLIQKEQGGFTPELFSLMQERAEQILQECRPAVGAAGQSKGETSGLTRSEVITEDNGSAHERAGAEESRV